MNYRNSHCSSIKRLCLCLVLLYCLFAPASAQAEADDSSLFMEAFSAFQRKDYLFSIEKLTLLEQLYPESPLRDVSLLLLARSQLRSGNNAAAARVANHFTKEFGAAPLAESIEPELISLGKKQQAGVKLPTNKSLYATALNVRNEQLALERAAALKADQERLALERAERERIARQKAEAERREQERLAAIKTARAAIRFDLKALETLPLFEAGTTALMPFELSNESKLPEEFSIVAVSPSNLEGVVIQVSGTNLPTQKVLLQPKQKIKLLLAFTMPQKRVDGSRIVTAAKAASTKFTDISKTLEMTVVTAAPLLRAVSRLQQQSIPATGDALNYKVTLLNVGSRPAKGVEVRVNLPQQLKLVDAGGNGCHSENEQRAVCRIEMLHHGQLTDRILKVAVQNDVPEHRGKGSIEVFQTLLQIKDIFPAASFTAKQPDPSGN